MSSNEQTQQAADFPEELLHHHWHHRRWKMPFFVVGIIFIKSALVMVLWNHLVPDLFRGPELHYLQAVGLTLLAKLFVGFGGHRHFGGPFGRHAGHLRHHWAALSPEEREKLREGLRKRFNR